MRAIAITIVLSCMNQFTGCFTFLTYAGSILAKSGSTMNPYTCTIILGVVQIVASLLTTHLADRLGRKSLLIVSLFGTVLGQMSLASFAYLQEREYDLSMFDWVPVTSLSFIIFIGTVGVVPLSSICTVEVLPEKVIWNFISNKWIINWMRHLISRFGRSVWPLISSFWIYLDFCWANTYPLWAKPLDCTDVWVSCLADAFLE